jgi:ABC-type transport system substrate-binding protein
MLNARRLIGFPLFFLCLAAVGTAGLLLRKSPEEKPQAGGTLVIKAYQTPFNPVFDPAASASHYFVIEQLFDGLVKFDNNFGIIPALAEYWTISDDGKRITFYLRKGVRFHHGREMTAEDVKFSLERLIQNRPGNTCYQYFTGKVAGSEDFRQGKAAEVSGFRVLDRYTFEIQWMRPSVSGLYLLGMYYCKILPKDLLLAQGSDFFQKPVGTGPFKFSSWLRDERNPRLGALGVRLERNYLYFGKKPYLDALEYSPNFTDSQFQDGLVHIVPVTSDSLLGKRLQVLENNSLRSASLALSCHIPPLDRAEVRKALALGINKARLTEAAYSASSVPQVTQNYIPPLLPGFFPRDMSPVCDPEKARMLLARLLPETGGRLTLTLAFVLPKRDVDLNFSRELERELEAIGVKLVVRYLKAAENIRDIHGPYLKLLEWNMDFPDPENVILPLFGSRSLTNQLNSHYSNSRLDALLEQSEVEPSWERRTDLFRQMEQVLYEEIPAIPLFSERVRIALRPVVRGAKLPALGFFFLDTKEIWLDRREKSDED